MESVAVKVFVMGPQTLERIVDDSIASVDAFRIQINIVQKVDGPNAYAALEGG